jgi:hypothetical protein
VGDHAIIPSSALLKAMIINSAVPMLSARLLTGATVPLGLPPDPIQGHGRVKLDEVLNIRGSRDLYVADDRVMAEGQEHVWKFTISGEDARPFKVREPCGPVVYE